MTFSCPPKETEVFAKAETIKPSQSNFSPRLFYEVAGEERSSMCRVRRLWPADKSPKSTRKSPNSATEESVGWRALSPAAAAARRAKMRDRRVFLLTDCNTSCSDSQCCQIVRVMRNQARAEEHQQKSNDFLSPSQVGLGPWKKIEPLWLFMGRERKRA